MLVERPVAWGMYVDLTCHSTRRAVVLGQPMDHQEELDVQDVYHQLYQVDQAVDHHQVEDHQCHLEQDGQHQWDHHHLEDLEVECHLEVDLEVHLEVDLEVDLAVGLQEEMDLQEEVGCLG